MIRHFCCRRFCLILSVRAEVLEIVDALSRILQRNSHISINIRGRSIIVDSQDPSTTDDSTRHLASMLNRGTADRTAKSHLYPNPNPAASEPTATAFPLGFRQYLERAEEPPIQAEVGNPVVKPLGRDPGVT
jgi:hypothetical protein